MDTPHYGWGLPPNVSTYGAGIDQLINILHIFMAVLFIGWGIFFIYCLIRFRQRAGHKASYESAKSKFPKYLEVCVALFELALLLGISYPIWSKMKYKLPDQKDALVVRVVAQQFAWNIHYPGKDGKFGPTAPQFVSDSNPVGLDLSNPDSADDITTLNVFHFPVDRPVIVKISSKDVIHSFFIPVLRVKQDAIPGMEVPIWFQANQTGHFQIACAQLCGNGHTNMAGQVYIDTAADYEAWMKEQEASLTPPAPAAAAPTPNTTEESSS